MQLGFDSDNIYSGLKISKWCVHIKFGCVRLGECPDWLTQSPKNPTLGAAAILEIKGSS